MQDLSTSFLSLLSFALDVIPWKFSHGLRVSWTFFLKLGIFYFPLHFFKSCELILFRDSSSFFSVSFCLTKVNFYSHCVKTVCATPSPNLHTTYDLCSFLHSNSILHPIPTLNTVFSINVLFAHKKYHQLDIPGQVGFKISLGNHTESSLPSSATQLLSFLKTSNRQSHSSPQRRQWHLLSFLTALWQMGSRATLRWKLPSTSIS